MHTSPETITRLEERLALLTRKNHDSELVRNALTALRDEKTDWPVFRELYDRLEAERMRVWRLRMTDTSHRLLQPREIIETIVAFREACWSARTNVLNSGPLGKSRPGWLGGPLPPVNR